jgi:arginase family enzyme
LAPQTGRGRGSGPPRSARQAGWRSTAIIRPLGPLSRRSTSPISAIFRIAHGDIQGTLAKIEAQAAPLGHVVALGGDHTITIALPHALARCKGPLRLLHFDDHVDTWPESFGHAWGHGSPFYHAIEEGLLNPLRTI